MPNRAAHVARTSEDLTHINTLRTRPEIRNIVLAEGIGFHNDQKHVSLRIPDCLLDTSQNPTLATRVPLEIEAIDDNHFEFHSRDQGVRYVVERIFDRGEFQRALEDPKLHVIYAGHARFGRGPCFGRGFNGEATGEVWENGTAPDNGQLRMGYPFIGIPVEEIAEHRYTADLVSADDRVNASDSHPELRRNLAILVPKTADEIADRTLALEQRHKGDEAVRFDLLSSIKDPDPLRRWWAYDAFDHGHLTTFVVLHAGWQDTATDPLDLGGTNIACRVFFHCGCSTFLHNHHIVRNEKGYQKGEDERYAFWTTAPSEMSDALFYLYHLFAFSKPGAFGPWGPSIDHAVRNANVDLSRAGLLSRIK